MRAYFYSIQRENFTYGFLHGHKALQTLVYLDTEQETQLRKIQVQNVKNSILINVHTNLFLLRVKNRKKKSKKKSIKHAHFDLSPGGIFSTSVKKSSRPTMKPMKDVTMATSENTPINGLKRVPTPSSTCAPCRNALVFVVEMEAGWEGGERRARFMHDG